VGEGDKQQAWSEEQWRGTGGERNPWRRYSNKKLAKIAGKGVNLARDEAGPSRSMGEVIPKGRHRAVKSQEVSTPAPLVGGKILKGHGGGLTKRRPWQERAET